MATAKGITADFPYKSRHSEVHGSMMYYVDEGAGGPILFPLGNPTSSYLWRNIIAHVIPLARCVAPDLIGMGRSDKPDIDYRLFDHLKYIESFIKKLELRNITLVVHGWGSSLGFHYAMLHESNVKGLALMEAILMPVPSWQAWPEQVREVFQRFRTPDIDWDLFVKQNMFIEEILPGAVVRKLTA